MNILYKSDYFNTYIYYILYPIIIGVCAYFAYKIITYGSIGVFSVLILLILFYGLLISFISLIKLRYVEIYEDKILVKALNRIYQIDYKDIEHVYDVKSVNGLYMILWYTNPDTKKSKVIYTKPKIDPKLSNQAYILNEGELEAAKFIREKSIASNPNYLSINKASRWFLFDFNF